MTRYAACTHPRWTVLLKDFGKLVREIALKKARQGQSAVAAGGVGGGGLPKSTNPQGNVGAHPTLTRNQILNLILNIINKNLPLSVIDTFIEEGNLGIVEIQSNPLEDMFGQQTTFPGIGQNGTEVLQYTVYREPSMEDSDAHSNWLKIIGAMAFLFQAAVVVNILAKR